MGLLAETIGTGRLTEADAINVARLAALDPTTRARALIGVDQLRGLDPCDVSPADRERLIELLGLYGLRQAVALAGGGAPSASDLSEGLREASGIDALREVLAATITARAPASSSSTPRRRACTRLALAHRDALGPDASAHVQAVVEQIRLDPDMHQLTEMDLLRELAAGTLDVASDLATELHTLLGPGTPGTRLGIGSSAAPDEVTAAATKAATRWNAVENDLRSNRATQRARASPTSRRCTCGARHRRKPRGERVVGARRADGIVQAPGSALRPAHTTPARESGALDRWR